MNIAICDDDKDQVRLLKRYVQEYEQVEYCDVVDVFSSGEALLENYKKDQAYDIVFLDGEMGGISGVETAEGIRKIDSYVIIVFISGYQKFVAGAFKLNAFQFLIKPVSKQEFHSELDRAFKFYQTNHHQYKISDKGQLTLVEIKDIIYMEAYNRKITLKTIEKSYILSGKLNDEETKMRMHGFVRVHQGFLVNMEHIKNFQRDSVILKNGEELPTSERRRKQAYDTYTKYLMGYTV